jgi:phage portal protein BeeE
MNFITKLLFGSQLNQLAIQQASLINQNLYRFIGNDMPILNADQFDYVGRGLEAVGAVYECVSMITNKWLEAPLITYEVVNQAAYKKYKTLQKTISDNPLELSRLKALKASAMQEVEVPAISKLLNQPNSKMNGIDFREMLSYMFLISGNSFIYGNPKTEGKQDWAELFALPDMKIISGGITDPIKEYYLFWNTQMEQRFPADQIKHVKTANVKYGLTGQQLYGVAPLKPYLWDLDYLKNSSVQADKQAKNGTSFGIVAPKNKEDQFGNVQELILKMVLIGKNNNPSTNTIKHRGCNTGGKRLSWAL